MLDHVFDVGWYPVDSLTWKASCIDAIPIGNQNPESLKTQLDPCRLPRTTSVPFGVKNLDPLDPLLFLIVTTAVLTLEMFVR